MKSNLLFKKEMIALLISIISFSCVKDKDNTLFYDKVEYYHSDYYKIPGPPDNTPRFEVYYSDFVNENNKTHYKNLPQFGFVKNEINDELSIQLKDFFTGHNPGEYFPDYKCLNCYQDIMLFYKKDELIGIAKFDFKCNKYCYTNFLQNKKIFLKRDCGKYRYLFKN
ncbi:hypothetical protein [Flavobacterium foetidum]|uniref:hypothetical protein n=1 Tax=Flavobacterium foetidum TaxID=2026681 RepID=UPI001074E20E|nr:hypothetical protein [Flavobacterium foetidum]KAF2514342.1 hypothetical protein E0W73_13160 [Flavobacterium foetidum]